MGPDQGCLQTTFVLLPVILDNLAEPCFPWGKDRNNGLALRESPNLQEKDRHGPLRLLLLKSVPWPVLRPQFL